MKNYAFALGMLEVECPNLARQITGFLAMYGDALDAGGFASLARIAQTLASAPVRAEEAAYQYERDRGCTCLENAIDHTCKHHGLIL